MQYILIRPTNKSNAKSQPRRLSSFSPYLTPNPSLKSQFSCQQQPWSPLLLYGPPYPLLITSNSSPILAPSIFCPSGSSPSTLLPPQPPLLYVFSSTFFHFPFSCDTGLIISLVSIHREAFMSRLSCKV